MQPDADDNSQEVPKKTRVSNRESLQLFIRQTSSMDDHESLFGKLARYTRFVLFGKWFLGGFAILMLLVLTLWPLIGHKSGTRVSLVSSAVVPGAGDNDAPRMLNPRYQSIDKKNRQYTIAASSATQQTKDLVLLETVASELLFDDQSWLTVSANKGDFTESTEMLNLFGNVILDHAAGYKFVTEHAYIDVDAATAEGNGAVNGAGPMGKLLATGFKIRDNGDYMFFGKEGRVHVTITKEQQAKSQE